MEFLKDLRKQLAKKGVNIINTDYYDYIDMWENGTEATLKTSTTTILN